MNEKGLKADNATVESYGIKNATAHWNLDPLVLSKLAVDLGQAKETSTGAITVDTGEFTGRSPQDRFIVKDAITEDAIWWGNINIPFEADAFDKLYDKVVDYLSGKEIYVRDAIACADPCIQDELTCNQRIPLV